MDKKQELTERIIKLLEPIEHIGGYGFKIDLFVKQEKLPSDHIQINYNYSTGIAPYVNCTI